VHGHVNISANRFPPKDQDARAASPLTMRLRLMPARGSTPFRWWLDPSFAVFRCAQTRKVARNAPL